MPPGLGGRGRSAACSPRVGPPAPQRGGVHLLLGIPAPPRTATPRYDPSCTEALILLRLAYRPRYPYWLLAEVPTVLFNTYFQRGGGGGGAGCNKYIATGVSPTFLPSTFMPQSPDEPHFTNLSTGFLYKIPSDNNFFLLRGPRKRDDVVVEPSVAAVQTGYSPGQRYLLGYSTWTLRMESNEKTSNRSAGPP